MFLIEKATRFHTSLEDEDKFVAKIIVIYTEIVHKQHVDHNINVISKYFPD